ncbi:hypothetical protein EO95_03825 [Methanosarcina sp. 1.H.T.1A.1]|uniref:hypothetical protein n=1 Tax=Methanosarcina sp. 1.H.T.1A.1 TaxID=1483602 RepID=UPI0006212FFC|nr:hypothetical protein [Methanosarcina sp. 1.H.T.1A.1]KKH96886.1 hypothetical protein EO95_03825 [Methanosarcina sp. 1.H.T.1A.1]
MWAIKKTSIRIPSYSWINFQERHDTTNDVAKVNIQAPGFRAAHVSFLLININHEKWRQTEWWN